MIEKVLLINSPIYDHKVADKEDYLPPFGLGYIATQLKKEKFDVEIIDAVYSNYTIDELLTIIENKKPVAVGINIFSINFPLVKELIEKCMTKTKFIVGGKSTKFLYDQIINFTTNNEINVTIGEGEYITSHIITNSVEEPPLKKVIGRNVYQVNNDSIYFPTDLDQVELDRTFFENRKILNSYGDIEEAIVTSRECLYNCAFCGGARSLNLDVKVRNRSIDNIFKELNYIATNHKYTKSIRILDDLFLKNRKSIVDAINLFNKFNFNYRAMSHVMSLQDSEDLLPLLYESGCKELEIGIESGSQRIRDSIHKVGSVELVEKTIKKVLESGINVKGYLMYGLPDETEKDCLETYKLAKNLYDYSLKTPGNFRTSAFQFRPYHGTELFNKVNGDIKYIHDDSLDNLDGRKQFNFTAGNFSKCPQTILEKLIVLTNNLDKGNTNDKSNIEVSKMSTL